MTAMLQSVRSQLLRLREMSSLTHQGVQYWDRRETILCIDETGAKKKENSSRTCRDRSLRTRLNVQCSKSGLMILVHLGSRGSGFCFYGSASWLRVPEVACCACSGRPQWPELRPQHAGKNEPYKNQASLGKRVAAACCSVYCSMPNSLSVIL